MSIKVNVKCPICGADLSYVHKEDEAWGMIQLGDSAIAEITTHDGGNATKHMGEHHLDGTFLKAWEKKVTFEAQRAEHYFSKIK